MTARSLKWVGLAIGIGLSAFTGCSKITISTQLNGSSPNAVPSQASITHYERDIYGGVISPTFQTTQRTGYFHAEKINKRWTIFDPLGNPFFYLGVQNIRIPTFHDLGA